MDIAAASEPAASRAGGGARPAGRSFGRPRIGPAVLLGALLSGVAGGRDLDVAISEIHYHPVTSADDEFLELHNSGEETVDLSGWTLTGGIGFTFRDGTTVGPRDALVVARNAARLAALHGLPAGKVTGNFTGKLGNDGDTVVLRGAAGELVDRVAYEDGGPWPDKPDGFGPSLERTDLLADGEQQWVWRASIPLGGTPGEANSTRAERRNTVLVAAGDTWRYRKGTSEPAAPRGAWAAAGFDDGSWARGPSGFGYGDGDDATVLGDMRGGYTTVYLRADFNVSDPAAIESLVLTVIYDDAYVAYLNGTEVGRSASAGGAPGVPLPYNALAAANHEAGDGADVIELAASLALRSGWNVLALQGLNAGIDSSDLSLIPTLTALEVLAQGPAAPAADLEVNEVFAGASPAEAFVEITNEGEETVDLAGMRLVTHPLGLFGYEFPPGTEIAPGGFLTVSGTDLPFPVTGDGGWYGLSTADGLFIDGLRARAHPPGRACGRFPDGDGDTFVLEAPTPGAPNVFTADGRLVITEVHFHPPPGREAEEFVEVHNRSAASVDLGGWSLDGAVSFTMPAGVVLGAGGYAVIAGAPAAVEARYGLAGVLGPWSGRLSNGEEKLELLDPLGNRADVVHYADDGTWPATSATAGPDGLGASIELLHPWMENNHGSAWAASSGAGTPGTANSRRDPNPPPVIRSPSHSPAQPRPGEPVTVTARVHDETSVASVRVFYRTDGAPSFSQAAMADDGQHGDGRAGDGRYGAALPARGAGTIVEWYISAADTTGETRTFPASAPSRGLLYPVDDGSYPAGLPLYRAVLRRADFDALTMRDLYSDVLLYGTFIRGDDVIYEAGVRYRGEHSRTFPLKSFRIQFTHDQPFEGIQRLNLNAEDNHLAHLASDFLRRSDVPTFQTRLVAFTLNGNFANAHGGLRLRTEAVDGDFVSRRFPGDDTGNLYRGRDLGGSDEADLSYRGPDPADYQGIYEKKTNELENDITDVVELTGAFANTPDSRFLDTIGALVDIDEWLRFFAAEAILSNQDGAIATGTGEDYFIYHRPSDGRWVIIPWDQNETLTDPGVALFRPSSAAVQRLLRHPQIVRRYLAAVLSLLDGPFDESQMLPRADSLAGFVASSDLDVVRAFVGDQQALLRAALPRQLTAGVEPRFLVRSGDRWRFFRGRQEPSGGSTAWTARSFNDDSWEEGPGGFGYGDGDDRTVLADMRGNYTTVYIRREFELEDPAAVVSLTLSVRYDDAFVLYLNGTEVARRNVSGTVRFDSRASADHEAGAPSLIDISPFRDRLVAGTNVAAAVGVNASSASSDLSLDLEIHAPAAGGGCGNRLFADSSLLSLGGTAPILETAAVEVNGEPAAYEPDTGHWHHETTLAPGTGEISVRAFDERGSEVAAAELEVVPGGSVILVGGTLSSAIWRATSPYIVSGEASLPAGRSLEIEPGTLVTFEPGSSLTVAGTLNVPGTASEPVIFQATTCGGAWGGLAFTGASARGVLQYCEISGASTSPGGVSALTVSGGASVELRNCRLGPLAGAAIDASGSTTELRVLDTLIEGSAEAIHAAGAFAQVERTHIRNLFGKSDCIDFDGESTPRSVVRDCLLENGPDDGIDLGSSSALLEGNVIHGMACKGVSLEGVSTPEVRRTLVYDSNDGIVAKDSVTAVLEHCTVVRNQIGLHFFEKNAGRGGGHATGASSIVWGNGRSVLLDGLSTLELTFSDVEGGYPGAGNGDFDPLFVDPDAGDFHLSPGSPALGAGRDGEDMGAFPGGPPPAGTFVRGDANEDGSVDLSDAVRILGYLFRGSAGPRCADALDADDGGRVEITDAIGLLGFLFRGGPAPPPPFPRAGPDPTADSLPGCR